MKSPDVKSSASRGKFVLLMLLPALDTLRLSYMYSSLPLHFLDSGWPLWILGLIFSLGSLMRLPQNLLMPRVGEWLAAPLILIAASGSVAMVIWPDNLVAVVVGNVTSPAVYLMQAWRGFCFRRYSDSPAIQTQALRVVQFSDVVGYSAGTLVGGVLYQFGGYRACAHWQLQVALLECVCVLCFVPDVHESFRVRRGHQIAPEAAPTDAKAPTKTLTLRSARVLVPVAIVLTAEFWNLFSYAAEWAVYAIYFKEAYGWGSAWTGAAQMFGDAFAAIILFVSTLPCCQNRSWPRALSGLLEPPVMVAVLMALYCMLFSMLADEDHFAVAVTGQIFLGTVYVFCEQAVQELLVVYSRGDVGLYRTLCMYSTVVYNVGQGSTGFIALAVYENVGRTAPFVGVAAITGVTALCFGLYYRARLGPFRRWFGRFAAAEAELLRAPISMAVVPAAPCEFAV